MFSFRGGYGGKETPEQYRARKERIAREKEQRHQEYLERQRVKEQRHQEYLERQRVKEQRHQEYLKRQQEREQRQQEFLARQRENAKKFEFSNTVIKWQVYENKLYCPESSSSRLAKLSPYYPYPSGREQYFSNFKPLILEEARAVIRAGLEKLLENKIDFVTLQVVSCNQSKNDSIPCKLTLKGRIDWDEDFGTSAIVLMEATTKTILFSHMPADNSISAKCYLDQKNQYYLQKGQSIRVYPLGALITQKRMYDVCNDMPKFSFEQQVISADFNVYGLQNTGYTPLYESLNELQSQSVHQFLQLKQGLQLLQGPPGTGKTTTIATLIKQLYQRGAGRVFVSAPSNKAVQVIAKRLLVDDGCSLMPIILAGVEKKLDKDLQQIFLHTWRYNVLKIVGNILRTLEIPQLNKGQEKFLEKNIQQLSLIVNRYVGLNFIKSHFYNLSGLLQKAMLAKSIGQLGYDLTALRVSLQSLSKFLSATSDVEIEKKLLEESRVVFATASASGRRTVTKAITYVDALIFDEASQAVEAETLIPFALNPRKCLLVGDTKQLPATVISELAVNYNYHHSMMWRLIEVCKGYSDMLTMQYRMEPEIRLWPSNNYYGGLLQDGENITKRPNSFLDKQKSIFSKPYAFIDVPGQESTIGRSYQNKIEAEICIKVIAELCFKKNIAQEAVGVITFYSGQVDLVNKLMNKRGLSKVQVSSVDGFQGGEKDFIMILFVRANQKGIIGFLKDFRRLNVAITRAKLMLLMLGDSKTLANGNSDVGKLLANAKQRGRSFGYDILLDDLDITTQNKKTNIEIPSAIKSKHSFTTGKIKGKPYTNSNKYKTALCRFFSNRGSCHRGQACNFAHGEHQLRK